MAGSGRVSRDELRRSVKRLRKLLRDRVLNALQVETLADVSRRTGISTAILRRVRDDVDGTYVPSSRETLERLKRVDAHVFRLARRGAVDYELPQFDDVVPLDIPVLRIGGRVYIGHRRITEVTRPIGRDRRGRPIRFRYVSRTSAVPVFGMTPEEIVEVIQSFALQGHMIGVAFHNRAASDSTGQRGQYRARFQQSKGMPPSDAIAFSDEALAAYYDAKLEGLPEQYALLAFQMGLSPVGKYGPVSSIIVYDKNIRPYKREGGTKVYGREEGLPKRARFRLR
jgi:hypothetical protein